MVRIKFIVNKIIFLPRLENIFILNYVKKKNLFFSDMLFYVLEKDSRWFQELDNIYQPLY